MPLGVCYLYLHYISHASKSQVCCHIRTAFIRSSGSLTEVFPCTGSATPSYKHISLPLTCMQTMHPR